jgi:hypothetical protein
MQLRQELDVLGLKPAAISGERFAIAGDDALEGAREIWAATLVPTVSSEAAIKAILEVLNGQHQRAESAEPNDGGNGAAPSAKADDGAGTPAKPGQAQAPPIAPSGTAPVITASTAALGDASGLWIHVSEDDRSKLAERVIPRLYEDRSSYVAASRWAVAPELVLFDLLTDDTYRGRIAEAALRVRTGVTDTDDKRRAAEAARASLENNLVSARVQLVQKDVELAGQRVALAEKGIDMAGELFAHMKKWRAIANWGLAVLLVTTLFSLWAVSYVLRTLLPAEPISDVAAPVMVFVLTLFAISPAVLLLRERPLKGLDQWMPGGKADDGKDGGSTSSGTTASDGATTATATTKNKDGKATATVK